VESAVEIGRDPLVGEHRVVEGGRLGRAAERLEARFGLGQELIDGRLDVLGEDAIEGDGKAILHEGIVGGHGTTLGRPAPGRKGERSASRRVENRRGDPKS
jgi:hypothetical protein